ncbi:hypothetical protein LZK80_37780 (plasmid) [Rhizobium leguminosarum]|nr:hypothetical protein LZK80_37780 [Rhizobium leguminosarum]
MERFTLGEPDLAERIGRVRTLPKEGLSGLLRRQSTTRQAILPDQEGFVEGWLRLNAYLRQRMHRVRAALKISSRRGKSHLPRLTGPVPVVPGIFYLQRRFAS